MSVQDPLTYTMGGYITLKSSDLQSHIERERYALVDNEGDGEMKVMERATCSG